MRSSSAPPTWRVLELFNPTQRRCPHCHQPHRYLMRVSTQGACLPVLFPPGVAAPITHGDEVDVFLAGPADPLPPSEQRSAYRQVAERVKSATIRCEGCGERFDDLERYRLHACEVRYR